MLGGKLIGTGSSSCVLNPGINCSTKKLEDKEYRSFISPDSKNMTDYEKTSQMISKLKDIKNGQLYTISFVKRLIL